MKTEAEKEFINWLRERNRAVVAFDKAFREQVKQHKDDIQSTI